MVKGGGVAKVYVVFRGGNANVYKNLQGGRGVQKVQNLVYVENGCPLMTQHTVYPSEAHVNGQRGYYYSRRSNLLLVVVVVHYLVLYSMYIMCMATTKYLQSFFQYYKQQQQQRGTRIEVCTIQVHDTYTLTIWLTRICFTRNLVYAIFQITP